MRTLYLSDLDGTLFNHKKEVSDYSAYIINRCIKAGMMFSIATARMPYGCDYRLEGIRLGIPAILTNGVFIYDFKDKSYLNVEGMEDKTAEKVIDAFQKSKKDCFMYLFHENQLSICYGDEKMHVQKQYYSERALRSCKEVYITADYKAELQKGMAVYFSLTGKKEELTSICTKLSQIKDVNYTCYLNIYNGLYCLEVFSNKASKSRALKWLKNYLQCDEVVVFGDNWNDMPMIEAADRSYAPENALTEIKEKVTGVIEDCDQDGVAKFLDKEFYYK